MKTISEVIPYREQRYTTCGDYWFDGDGNLQVRVNDMGNPDYEFLVEMHERIEEHFTRKRGLKEPDIMAFDIAWEKERAEGKHSEDDEPGHDSRAPYNREHVFAECIERLIAAELGVSWLDYERAVLKSCEGNHPIELCEVHYPTESSEPKYLPESS